MEQWNDGILGTFVFPTLQLFVFNSLFQHSAIASLRAHHSNIPWKRHKPRAIKKSLISTNCRISETFKYENRK